MISDNLKTTIATKTTTSGIIVILREQSRDSLHFADAKSISLADSRRISAVTVNIPYSGIPTDDTEDIVLVVVVDIIVLVSMSPPPLNIYVLLILNTY